MINPTGKPIRNDEAGDGHHGASRGSRIHDGVDFLATPGQKVSSPIDGVIKRGLYVYNDDVNYTGLEISNDQITIKLFYIDLTSVVGDEVKAGKTIGRAQDISKKYGAPMQPHVHLRVTNVDPMLLMEKSAIVMDDQCFQSHS